MRAAGRMGGERVTVRNLKVVRVDPENHLLVVEGAIPGAPGRVVDRAQGGRREAHQGGSGRETEEGEEMTVDVVNASNEKVGQIELHDAVFGGRVNADLIWESVVRANASDRRGTHATKNRALVSGSGKKPWRQKGTGRARVGDIRTPLSAARRNRLRTAASELRVEPEEGRAGGPAGRAGPEDQGRGGRGGGRAEVRERGHESRGANAGSAGRGGQGGRRRRHARRSAEQVGAKSRRGWRWSRVASSARAM